jgi:hypothetical protein
LFDLQPFPWRKLTPRAELEYRLDEAGRIVVRGTGGLSPGDVSQERAVPCYWERVAGESWALRTKGPPSTVARLHTHLGDLIRRVSAESGVDERILLVQCACEARYSKTHASGKDPKSPRTEDGYPDRRGEMDFGDFDRDARDWAASGGRHSSHGLTQCLISTAVWVRPDLFAGVEPRDYRKVLWEPEAAFRCLAALVPKLPASVQRDPLAMRVTFGAGLIRPSPNRWGVMYWGESVVLHWVAFWNDYAALIGLAPDPPPRDP